MAKDTTVSYTHLDVYKRQFWCSSISISDNFPWPLSAVSTWNSEYSQFANAAMPPTINIQIPIWGQMLVGISPIDDMDLSMALVPPSPRIIRLI